MNKRIIILLRVPFLDKIPSLKTLIIYLSRQSYNITIITTQRQYYPPLTFSSDNIKLKLVKERTKRIGIPTSIKLFTKCLCMSIKEKPLYFIGGDSIANKLLSLLSKFLPIKYINFLLEYPDLADREEKEALERANYIITHDVWHKKFLLEHYDLTDDKFLFLPNASYTQEYYGKSDYLFNVLQIPKSKKIILHSGGLGPWFLCKELAELSRNWTDEYILVFHTSHNVNSSEYYREIKKENIDNKNLKFSTTPVSNENLDNLVSSAYIGVALYSLNLLSYRATYMGLAAGKIGNYLKCGLPVIATKLPSLNYIEEYQCGILINTLDEFPNAVSKINTTYDRYSMNAHRCYKELWEPTQYLEVIRKTICEY